MTDIPEFPAKGLRVAQISRLSYGKLRAGDAAEIQRLFEESIDYGFFLLDLNDCAEGKAMLDQVDSMFSLSQEFFAQDWDTKTKLPLRPGNIG